MCVADSPQYHVLRCIIVWPENIRLREHHFTFAPLRKVTLLNAFVYTTLIILPPCAVIVLRTTSSNRNVCFQLICIAIFLLILCPEISHSLDRVQAERPN